MGGHSIFNHHGRLSVQGRRGGGGGGRKSQGGRENWRSVLRSARGGERKSSSCSCLQTHNSRHIKQLQEGHCLSPAPSSHEHQTITTWRGSLHLYCKPPSWTEADFQGISPLKRVIERDLHFNPCPLKRKSVCDLWLLSVIYYQGAQRGYRRLGDTVSRRLLRKSTSTRPNCLTAIWVHWWAAGGVKL